ncbi:MAG: hypothetical protein ABI954_09260 [Pyrinomonadaceae bacterium]
MFKNLRSLAARLTKYVNRFSSAPRREIKVPVSVSLDLERKTASQNQEMKALTVTGLTQDVSKSEVAFIVPFMRLGDHHLAAHGGEQKRLKLVLEMPNGRVRMTVATKHYQMVELHNSVQNYLIGAEIVSIYKGDAERYANYLRYGDKSVSMKNSAVELAPHKEKGSLLNNL